MKKIISIIALSITLFSCNTESNNVNVAKFKKEQLIKSFDNENINIDNIVVDNCDFKVVKSNLKKGGYYFRILDKRNNNNVVRLATTYKNNTLTFRNGNTWKLDKEGYLINTTIK